MKYVIHHHFTSLEHFDLMFEKDDYLETWQIDLKNFNLFLNGETVKTLLIKNHSKRYLFYQGQLSSGKGKIVRYDSGSYQERLRDQKKIIYELEGFKLKGTLNIKPNNGLSWLIDLK